MSAANVLLARALMGVDAASGACTSRARAPEVKRCSPVGGTGAFDLSCLGKHQRTHRAVDQSESNEDVCKGTNDDQSITYGLRASPAGGSVRRHDHALPTSGAVQPAE